MDSPTVFGNSCHRLIPHLPNNDSRGSYPGHSRMETLYPAIHFALYTTRIQGIYYTLFILVGEKLVSGGLFSLGRKDL